MKISFNVITEGDSKLPQLKKLLKSVEGVYDSVHITTNGGEPDGKQTPVAKVKAWCEENKYDYSHLPWNDSFSEQRNFNFARASKNTDFILWADTDDIIVNAHLIRDIAIASKSQGHEAVFFTYWYSSEFKGEPSEKTFITPEITQMRERLIKPGTVSWHKRIHESPVPFDGEKFKYTKVVYSKEYPIAWLHLGANRDIDIKDLEKRNARNKRLLEKELSDERKKGEADPRTVLYLMKVYAEEDDEVILKQCLELGREYLAKSGWDEERAVCYRLMSRCRGKLGDDEASRDLLFEAAKEYPFDPLIYLYLSRSFYNLKNYGAMKHWMDIALKMNLTERQNHMDNILEMKVMTAELRTLYYMEAEKDVEKAYKSARLLNSLNPAPEHQQNEEFLFDQAELNKASRNAHKLMKYFKDIGTTKLIPKLVESLPPEMRRLPFANTYYMKYKEPKIWESDEITYFANFGKSYLSKWDGNSLKTGIGGSETAVIRLAEEWVTMGYKVTIYGDPVKSIEINGVRYLPYFMFNRRDKFNIFVQWRDNMLSGKVSSKKFLIDLHDVWHKSSYVPRLDQIDKIMVKSKYHREFGKKIKDDKFKIVSNGI